jgi:hypothetical protein
MARQTPAILPLATALASLASVPATVDDAVAKTPDDASSATISQNNAVAQTGRANLVFKAGEDLLGLIITQQADGTIIAQHESHASHASHASHHSHYSGN